MWNLFNCEMSDSRMDTPDNTASANMLLSMSDTEG